MPVLVREPLTADGLTVVAEQVADQGLELNHRMARASALALAALMLGACTTIERHWPLRGPERSMRVTATAYNSHVAQTDRTPTLAAWGDTLRPGMKAIAVSPDLIPLGLTRGTRVQIEGLSGEYVVLDRMPSRWRRKIDIYMGNDMRAARTWGAREVVLRWRDAGAPSPTH